MCVGLEFRKITLASNFRKVPMDHYKYGRQSSKLTDY